MKTGKYRVGWKAYEKGEEAYYKGVKYTSNPYKIPAHAFNWSVGWLAARKDSKRNK